MNAERRAKIDAALAVSRDTRALELGAGALATVPHVFRSQFPARRAVVVGDLNTMGVAGDAVAEMLRDTGGPEPFVFADEDLYAEHRFVERLEESLGKHDAIPVAVGSGTINDVTKLAAHRTGRQYLCVATAASMDGYTAYGSSITFKGSKQTFDCPAPRAVVADIDIIRAAPPELSASGYADLLAKLTAGADWIVADMLGEEPIDPKGWDTVQDGLPESLSNPTGVRQGDPDAIERLTEGLMMGGFAMQATMTSRPASGAEHQFSHLWDMEHHTYGGVAPSHGFKVGVATLAVARFYEVLFSMPLESLDVDHAVAGWPTWEETAGHIDHFFVIEELREKALLESRAKYIEAPALREQLMRLKQIAPQLRQRLKAYLPPASELQRMLREAGAPTSPEQIGIVRGRLRNSFRLAYYIRRRFTVLDVAERAELLDACLTKVFPELHGHPE